MSDADSALSILGTIDATSLHNKDDLARFYLISSMAQYRLNDYAPNDSLISIAVDRYTATSDSERLMKALFLRADLRYQFHQFADAMTDALQAYELAAKCDSEDWKARTSEKISDLLFETQNFDEALPYIEEAIGHYRAAGKERNALFSLCDKAVALERIESYENGIQILDSLISISQSELNDTNLLIDCLKALYPMCMDHGHMTKGKEALVYLKSISDSSNFSSQEYSHLALAYLEDGNNQLAFEALQKANELIKTDYDRIAYYSILIQYYKLNNDLPNLMFAVRANQETAYSTIRAILKQSTLASESKFFQHKAAKERLKGYKNKTITLIVFITSLCLIIVILLINHIRIKHKNTIIENNIAETLDLNDQLHLAQNQILHIKDSLNSEIESLFKEQWSTLNQLCNRYFDSPNDSTSRTIVINEFEKQLKKIASPKSFTEIEDAVNRYMSNIMTKLRNECPFLKEEDLKLLVLYLAGFSPRSICLFLNINLKNFYTKRYRIIDRIKSKNPESLDLFLNKLSK